MLNIMLTLSCKMEKKGRKFAVSACQKNSTEKHFLFRFKTILSKLRIKGKPKKCFLDIKWLPKSHYIFMHIDILKSLRAPQKLISFDPFFFPLSFSTFKMSFHQMITSKITPGTKVDQLSPAF